MRSNKISLATYKQSILCRVITPIITIGALLLNITFVDICIADDNNVLRAIRLLERNRGPEAVTSTLAPTRTSAADSGNTAMKNTLNLKDLAQFLRKRFWYESTSSNLTDDGRAKRVVEWSALSLIQELSQHANEQSFKESSVHRSTGTVSIPTVPTPQKLREYGYKARLINEFIKPLFSELTAYRALSCYEDVKKFLDEFEKSICALASHVEEYGIRIYKTAERIERVLSNVRMLYALDTLARDLKGKGIDGVEEFVIEIERLITSLFDEIDEGFAYDPDLGWRAAAWGAKKLGDMDIEQFAINAESILREAGVSANDLSLIQKYSPRTPFYKRILYMALSEIMRSLYFDYGDSYSLDPYDIAKTSELEEKRKMLEEKLALYHRQQRRFARDKHAPDSEPYLVETANPANISFTPYPIFGLAEDFLKLEKDDVLVDVGAGKGNFPVYLQGNEKLPGKYYGVDNSSSMLKIMSQRGFSILPIDIRKRGDLAELLKSLPNNRLSKATLLLVTPYITSEELGQFLDWLDSNMDRNGRVFLTFTKVSQAMLQHKGITTDSPSKYVYLAGGIPANMDELRKILANRERAFKIIHDSEYERYICIGLVKSPIKTSPAFGDIPRTSAASQDPLPMIEEFDPDQLRKAKALDKAV